MKVYIVFGDRVRSDGGNIEGVFLNNTLANKYKETMESMCEDTTYSIEEHDVKES